MDLLDELGQGQSNEIGNGVGNLGGDLLDEAGIKTNNQELLSPKFTAQDATDERVRLLDEINTNMTGFEKFLVGAGRGLTTIARSAGLAEPEDAVTKEAFGRLSDDSISATAGEIVGEAAPFLAATPLAGAGLTATGRTLIPAAQTLGQKIAGTAALGAAEGAAITTGKGGDDVEIVASGGVGGIVGGTIEAISPVLGRLGRALFQRLGKAPQGPLLTPEGAPTPELQQALTDTGTSFQDLTEEAFAQVNQQGVDPSQATRAARFSEQGIPATAGDISQDFAQQSTEQRLLSQASGDAGEPLRQLKLNQSEAFKANVNELVESLGIPDEAGETVKQALSGRKKLLQQEKNALYRKVAETASEVANTPLFTNSIEEAIPNANELRRLSRLAGNQIDAVQDLLVEFGINKSDDALNKFTQTGGEVTPLTIGNFEDFRQAINQIERADSTGAAKVVTGPIKRALDAEAEIVDSAIKDVSGVDSGVLDILEQARNRVRTIKTEFSPQSITGRLVDVKRDGVTPVIEASRVTRELLKADSTGVAKIENLQRTLSSLRKAGEPGKKAIKDLQASVVLNALEDALRAPSRKTSGIETIGGTQFAKSLSNLGDAKLKELFRGNEKTLSRLLNLKQTAIDITPSAAATPKGSLPGILDIINRTSSLPGLAAIRDTISFVINAGADERAVRKAMNSKPAFRKSIEALKVDFPAIASALGVAAVIPEQENN